MDYPTPRRPLTERAAEQVTIPQGLPAPATAWQESEERLKRGDSTTWRDYASAAWNQDGITTGFVAALAGSHLVPDEGYTPFEEKEWQELTNGIDPQYHKELYRAHSAGHARYLKSLIEDKQRETQTLGDLGWVGNAGRMALSLAQPENLASGLVAGWAARGVRAYQMSGATRAVRAATTTEQRAAAVTEALATLKALEAGKGGLKGIATGVASGAASNMAFERMRQAFNFEDDTDLVIEAGLFGAAFSLPFAVMGARHSSRMAASIQREHDALVEMRRLHQEGKAALDGAEQYGKALGDAVQLEEHARKFFRGELEADEVIELNNKTLQDAGLLDPDEFIVIDKDGTVRTETAAERRQREYGDLLAPDEGDPVRPGTRGLEVEEIDTTDGAPRGPDETRAGVESTEVGMDEWEQALNDAFPPKEPPAPVEYSYTPDLDQFFTRLNSILKSFYRSGHRAIKAVKDLATLPEDIRLRVEASQVIAGIFGKKVVAFHQKGTGSGSAWGLAPRDRHDLILLNVDSNNHMAAVTGHEFLHQLRNTREDLYQELRGEILMWYDRKAHTKDGGWSDNYKRTVGANGMEEELVADVVGDAFATPRFWDDLAKRNPAVFGRVVPLITSFLRKLIDLVSPGAETAPGMRSGRYLRTSDAQELQRIYDTILKVADEYGTWVHEGMPPVAGKGGTAAPSPVRNAGDIRESPAPASAPADGPGTTAFNEGKAALLRWDYYALLNRSENPEVRKLAHMMVKDPIASSDTVAQRRTVSEWAHHFKRTIAGEFHREARDAFLEAARKRNIHALKRGGFAPEFYSAVTRLTRGDPLVADEFADILPELQRASAAQKRAYQRMLAEAKGAGVEGAAEVNPNDFYANRLWSVQRLVDAEKLHGRDAVAAVLAEAIRVPGKTGDVAAARRFLDAVKKLRYSPVLQDINLHAKDMGTLRSLLQAEGLGESEINDLVDVLFEAKALGSAPDAGQPTNLKFRFDIDENHYSDLPGGRLRISDFFENDSRLLMDVYVTSLGGHTGWAKHGITSRAAFESRLRQIEQVAMDKNLDITAHQKDLQRLRDLYAHTTGAPMSTQDYSASARAAHVLRGYTRSVMLGQLGLAAAFEMGNAVALLGFRGFWHHSSVFRNLRKAYLEGNIRDTQLDRDIQVMVGAGNERAMAYAREAELAEGWYDKSFTKIEEGANKLSHGVDLLSGNAGFTSVTKQIASKMAAQRLADYAFGVRALDAAYTKRLVGWGIDADQVGRVTADLKKYTEARGGIIESIDYEAWAREAPETYESFTTYLSRAARDSIQDQDIGEMMPFMHQTIGKLFGELRTFFMVAHAKQFLKNLHYRDATAFQAFTVGMVAQSLAYMTQTSMNYAHNPEELAKRLEPERIALAAFSRLSATGMVPFFMDTVYGTVTGEQLFRPGSTANTDSRNFLKPPSLTVAAKALGATPEVVGAAFGQNPLTSKEARDFATIFPGSNLYLMRNLIDAATSTLPATQPKPSP